MKNLTLALFSKLLLSFVLITLIFASCQKDATASFPDGEDEPDAAQLLAAKEKLVGLINSNKLISKFDLKLALKNGSKTGKNLKLQTREFESNAYLRLTENVDFMHYKNLVQKAINPKDYECGPTILDKYIPTLFKNWTGLDFTLFSSFGDFAFAEAYIYDNTNGGDYFGSRGEFSNIINVAFKDLKQFWDIPSNIQITDAHGSVYKDIPTMVKIIQLIFASEDEEGNLIPVAYDEALQTAKTLKLVFGSKAFMNYNHPLFTFNAFADEGIPELGIAKKIVMGDGIMKAYADLGYGDIASQYILAHEYGHQVDFFHKHIDFRINKPEYTRRFELGADAYGGYYIGHRQGFALPERKLQHFLEVPYSLGDCAFADPGHHGTPNQRKKAADYAYKTATSVSGCNKLTSLQFFDAFQLALPEIVAPDAKRGLVSEILK
jgi:hypothetical protein